MQKLNKNGSVEAFNYQMALNETPLDELNSGLWLVPADRFIELVENGTNQPVGLIIEPGDDIGILGKHASNASFIAINFPAFADGRGFSIARLVRESLQFTGEIIAIGSFIQDQLHYLMRCGFDGFIVGDDANIKSMELSLKEFTDAYQASADRPTPLFKRRA